MSMRIAGFLALICALAAPLHAETSLQPAGWDANLRLKEAVDINPDPHIVEINLDARVSTVEIAPGKTVEAWTYDGGLPGPLIRVNVGDRLIVHFTNHLPTPTTVHWHGIRIPNNMDGVPDVSQPDVKPGAAFTYDFVVPDAGLYWYHPHVASAAQVGFGLYGALLVEDPNDPVKIADQAVMVLSDIEITDKGTLESPDTGGSAGMAFGREGNHVLVNGREDRRITVRPGAPERWRVVNAAKSRYMELQLEGQTQAQPFVEIGVDGGYIEKSVETKSIVIAPGERVDLIVRPSGKPGQTLHFRSLLYDRGYGSTEARLPFDNLVTVAIAKLPADTTPLPAFPGRRIEPLSTAGATHVDIALTIDVMLDGSFKYGINGVPFAENKPIKATVGETQVWTITNKTKWSHPFHIHGFFFQVLDDSGQPVHPLAWRDTVDVPYDKTVSIVVRFEDRPGMWMYHCHILDHADGGLMGMIDLKAPGAEYSAMPMHDHGDAAKDAKDTKE